MNLSICALPFALDVHLLKSDYPVVAIWSAHQGDGEEGGTAIEFEAFVEGARGVLVTRPLFEVELRRPDRGTYAFLNVLQAGFSLGKAIDKGNTFKGFDAAQALELTFASGCVAAIEKTLKREVIMSFIYNLFSGLFALIQKAAGDWFLGLAARLTFASVLLGYFLNSALTKVGSGFPDFLIPSTGAYVQILPALTKSVSYDTDQISFIPWGLIVTMGTYAEFVLPVLVVIGLFTRLSALGMIGFIIVMTYVDITSHGVGAKTIGAPFDRFQDAAIADQRLLWLFPLVYLVIRGAGFLSFDGLLARFFRK